MGIWHKWNLSTVFKLNDVLEPRSTQEFKHFSNQPTWSKQVNLDRELGSEDQDLTVTSGGILGSTQSGMAFQIRATSETSSDVGVSCVSFFTFLLPYCLSAFLPSPLLLAPCCYCEYFELFCQLRNLSFSAQGVLTSVRGSSKFMENSYQEKLDISKIICTKITYYISMTV